MKIFSLLSVLILACSLVNATDYYWTPTSGTNWSTVANWKTGSFGGSVATVLPTSSDNVFIGNGSGNATIVLDINDTINNITIQGTGIIWLNTSNSSVLSVWGNATSSNTNGTGGGTATIKFNGTGSQSLTGNATTVNVGKLPNLTIDKSSGTLTLYNIINVGGSSTFTYTAGTIDAGTSTVNFYYNNTINGTFSLNNVEFLCSAATHVVSNTLTVNGNLKIYGTSTYTLNTGTIDLYGNLDHQASSASLGGGTATIVFKGSSNQTYAFNAGRLPNVKVDKSSGTLTPASGTTNLAVRTFELAGGDFTAPSTKLTIGDINWQYVGGFDAFIHTGGTFTHNSGTVRISPTTLGGLTCTVDLITSTSFYNFEAYVHKGGTNNTQLISVASGDTMDVTNNFYLDEGGLNGLYTVQGNLSIDVARGGSGVLMMTGSSNKTYDYTSGIFCNLLINKGSSATVTPLSGTTNLHLTSLILLAGSFTAPSGNLNLSNGLSSKVFDHQGGTFNHNSGTTQIVDGFNGGSLTLDVSSTTTFNNFTLALDLSNCTLSGGSGDTIRVGGNLTVTEGKLNTNVVLVSGNVSMTGASGSVSSAPICFKGSNNQTCGVTDKANGKIVIDKTGGSVTLTSTMTLDASGQTLTFVSGNFITTSTYLLTLASGITCSGASDASHVVGPIKKIGNIAFTFPVGNTSYYHPISITAPTSTGDAFTAEYVDSAYNETNLDATLTYASDCAYWNLDRTTGSSNVKVKLYWNSNTCDIYTLSTLKVARYNTTNSEWESIGAATTSGTTSSGNIETDAAQSTFGKYSIGKNSPSATASAGADQFICYGASTSIGGSPSGSNGLTPYSYAWSPSTGLSNSTSANPTANPTSTITYTLTVTDLDLTTASDQIIVVVNADLNVDAGVDQPRCLPNAVMLGGNPSASGGTTPLAYAWIPSSSLDSSAVANPLASPTIMTTYVLTVTDSNSCIAADTVIISVPSLLIADAGNDTLIEAFEEVVLGGTLVASGGSGVYAYNWVQDDYLDNPNSSHPTASVPYLTGYVLTVLDSTGCISTDTVIIQVSNPVINFDSTELQMDAVFTTNAGQIADEFNNQHEEILYYTNLPGLNLFFENNKIQFVSKTYKKYPLATDHYTASTDSAYAAEKFYRFDLEPQNINDSVIVVSDTVRPYMNFYLRDLPPCNYVRSYKKLLYSNLYPNIDLEYYYSSDELKYRFIVKPGGDVSDIEMKYTGADSLKLNGGDLEVYTPLGIVTDSEPIAYQGSSPVTCAFNLISSNTYSFNIGTFNNADTLIIDPILQFNSYFGTTYGVEDITSVEPGRLAIPNGGNDTYVIIGGNSNGDDLTTLALPNNLFFMPPILWTGDVYVAQMLANGQFEWITIYGGSHLEYLRGLKLDVARNIFFCGLTWSDDLPGNALMDEYDIEFAGPNALCPQWFPSDAYVVRLDEDGILEERTYYGGINVDVFTDLDIDNNGNVVACGYTESVDNANDQLYVETITGYVPAVSAFNSDCADLANGLIVSFRDDLNNRNWASLYGGPLADILFSIDHNTNAANDNRMYVAGITNSVNQIAFGNNPMFPTAGNTSASISLFADGNVYLGALNAVDGLGIVGTYFTGDGGKLFPNIVVDNEQAMNRLYLIGTTLFDTDLISNGCVQQLLPGAPAGENIFLTALDLELTNPPAWCTYFSDASGTRTSWSSDLLLTGCNGEFKRLFFCGSTLDDATNDLFIDNFANNTLSNIQQPSVIGATTTSGFVASFNTEGLAQWAGYDHPTGWPNYNDICLNHAWLTGDYLVHVGHVNTTDPTFTAAGFFTFDPTFNGGDQDGFLESINPQGIPPNECCAHIPDVTIITDPPNTICVAGLASITLTADIGSTPPCYYTFEWSNGSTGQVIVINDPEPGTYTVTVSNACEGTISASITFPGPPIVEITGPTVLCYNQTEVLTAIVTSGVSPFTYLWSTAETTAEITIIISGTYSVTVTDACGQTGEASITVGGCGLIAPNVAVIGTEYASLIPAFVTGYYSGTSGSVYIDGTLIIDIENITEQAFVFDNTEIIMGPMAKIVVQSPNEVKFQNQCFVHACCEMWDQIEVGSGARITIKDGSRIEDGLTAVHCFEGGGFDIFEAIFNKNRYGLQIGIVNDPYVLDVTNYPGTIGNTLFTCKDWPNDNCVFMLDFPGVRSKAGIFVTDVYGTNNERVDLGMLLTTGDPNIFENMDDGIRSSRSNTRIINSVFGTDILCNVAPYFDCLRNGIHVIGSPSNTPIRVVNIGDATVANGGANNTFTRCTRGILMHDNASVLPNSRTDIFIRNNTFVENIWSCIQLLDDRNGTEIEISGNTFRDNFDEQQAALVGYTVTNTNFGNSRNADVYLFNNYCSGPPNSSPSPMTINITENSFTNTNKNKSTAIMYDVDANNAMVDGLVNYNVIQGFQTGVHVRRGNGSIWGGPYGFEVSQNHIEYKSFSPPANINTGIGAWLESNNYIILKEHNDTYDDILGSYPGIIKGDWFSNATTTDSRDIQMTGNAFYKISNNDLYNSRFGLFLLNGNPSPLAINCNRFNTMFRAIRLFELDVPGDFGIIGGPSDCPHNAWYNILNRRIYSSSNTTGDFFQWYHETSSDDYDLTGNIGHDLSSTNILIPECTPSGPSACDAAFIVVDPEDGDPSTRDEALYPTVGTLMTETDDDSLYINYYPQLAAIYNTLRAAPGLISLGGANDGDYEDLYDRADATNLRHFARIRELINDSLFRDANDLNDSIAPANTEEAYQVIVNAIMLNRIERLGLLDSAAIDSIMSLPYDSLGFIASEIDSLYDVATLTFKEGGQATIQARAMLRMNVYELDTAAYDTSGARLDQVGDVAKVHLYPNPNSGNFTLVVDPNEAGHLSIAITDLLGRVILTQSLEKDHGVYNIQAGLASGSYHCIVVNGNHRVDTIPFIVINE